MLAREQNGSQTRPAAQVNSKLDRNLAAYVMAASATGVGILAAVQPVEAKIIYTPTNTQLTSQVTVDFDNDGTTDFTFSYGEIGYGGYLFGRPGNNKIMNDRTPSSVLPWGKRIGPAAAFGSQSVLIQAANFHSGCESGGNWVNKKGFYFGIQFSSAGHTHYGWIRLSVGKLCNRQVALMTGYAYETIADKPIIAGKTSGPEVADFAAPNQFLIPSNEPASLGLLARGAGALNIWRREEEVA